MYATQQGPSNRITWAGALLALACACIPDPVLGIDVCGKACSSTQDCGGNYACTSGICTGGTCDVAPPASASGTSSGQVGASSNVTTTSSARVASSSAAGGSSMSAMAGASSRAGSSSLSSSANSTGASSTSAMSGAMSGASSAGAGTSGPDCNAGTLTCTGSTFCSPSGACLPCDTPDHCGATCGACRSLNATLHEGEFYRCTSTTADLADACQVSACATSLANCDGQDANGCEVNVSTDPDHCGSCATTCPSGVCRDRRCDCPPSERGCPWGQECTQANRCSCENDSDLCDPVEDDNGNNLYECGGSGDRTCVPR